ncbi:V-type ATP synthase subunit A [Criblamydia sequanensis]|uniref:V-type ATP synthase alpha chain n=1 Tax=Candidatus Criblamydia sequanensis CRIB-18 TaxID=1437425 RepID=A0A090D211_9BACT|nr:V-type ATP synthase subunit A [Criblamydia sequanensis]CDR33963.1 V-type sodium ATPase catalytic subunit A [Criblamydia sequanensis CRIB-18]
MTQVSEEKKSSHAKGTVVKAFGNLLQVEFEGSVRQGEVAMVELNGLGLKAEVIEIAGKEVKIQVFEDTREVQLGTKVSFTGHLLEAELGPGLLTSVFDGLQNPLEDVADRAGLFLPRGIYLNALNRSKHWDFEPKVEVGATVRRGDFLGVTMEERFHHYIMVPFSFYGQYKVEWVTPAGSYTVDKVIAKIRGQDGKLHEITMVQKWPIKNALQQGEKVKTQKMMETGLRILDTQFPVMKGGTFCTPGPFGAGKTVLQHHLSKYSTVDIVVVCACGERAGEVVEILKEFPHLTDPHTGESLMRRTVIICNTSSMPVAARESSIYLGMTIAEYYRQMGLDVLLLADSTSRWAQALREMSGRLEEIPGEEAFPAYLASRIAEFYERSGVLELKQTPKNGSVTVGGAVSPAGGNFEEPVTQSTLAVVGAFLGLSRERSDSRRYPAIDPLISWSSYIEDVSEELSSQMEGWDKAVKRALYFLKKGDEIGKRMAVVGEEGTALEDLVTYLKGELYDFCYLQQNAFDKIDAYCPMERQVPLFGLIQRIFEKPFFFKTHDEAREYFLLLQTKIKNLNYLPFKSAEYYSHMEEIETLLNKND